MMFRKSVWVALFLTLFSSCLAANDNQISEEDIKSQINAIKSGNRSQNETAQTQNLGGALYFIEQKRNREIKISQLEDRIKKLPEEKSSITENIQELKLAIDSVSENAYQAFSIAELESRHTSTQQKLQVVQAEINDLSSTLEVDRNLVTTSQNAITENVKRLDEINRLRNSIQMSQSLKDKLTAEIDYIQTDEKYNTLLIQYSDAIIKIDEIKRNKANLQSQLLQKQLTAIQTVLNEKRLKDSEQKALQIESQKENSAILNYYIKEELEENTELGKYLLKQTQRLNSLSQDNLRIKNVLESLTQTQRNIEEQISVLQGTLALSQIINKQKQSLPTENIVKNLSASIANLRVSIFEYTQQHDELYNIDEYVKSVNETQVEPFLEEEETAFRNLLTERKAILEDIIKTLNNELTISNQIENNQKQVTAISDSLQQKLQQQSFWVKSNNPIDLTWLKSFPKLAISELSELSAYIGFENLDVNLAPTLVFISLLLVLYALIIWKKAQIKRRLSVIANNVNTLKRDSHWLTPEAMFWTLVLALPSTLLFTVSYSVVVYFFFDDPLLGWNWGLQLSLYWLFFATMLSLLRPNGIAFRHFGMPQASNAIFERIIRLSIWIVALLVVSYIPSQVEIIGFANDVIGQVMTIIALALCLFVVRPLLSRGIQEYANTRNEDGSTRSVSLFKLLQLVLIIAPITLIVLIIMGYYYTAVYLISHLLNTYFVALVWVFGRYFAYRSVAISARRMAYRRLQEKRETLRAQLKETGKEEPKEKSDDLIKLSVVNQQIYRMTNLIGWVMLGSLLYMIWADLLSVAYYLDGVILWESVDGTQVETVTLLNLLRAVVYCVVTYALVKNIAGILEITLFSRIKFAKGTPHTVSAVLSYIIIVIGSVSAFGALGISWGKIQWVFTALSVGLGFGVREIFGSFVSGSILLFERPIRVGDKVTVGQHTGFITKIRLRSTTLINSDNMEVVLPNQAFVTDRFINWTLNNTITRLQIFLKVNYGADLDLVRELLFQAVNESPKVIADPKPEVNILNFSENALEHELIVFVGELGDRTETTNFLHYRINQLFQEHNIRFAFKQLDVHLHPAVLNRVAKNSVEGA